MTWMVLLRAWRARWRSLVLLAVGIGLTGGAALACVAGARRSASSLDRFEEAAQTLDVFLAGEVTTREPSALRDLLEGPLVESSNDLAFLFVDIDAVGFMFAPTSRRGLEVEQGVILEGRRADPDAPDEVVVPSESAVALGVDVGDVIESATFTPNQVAQLFETGDVNAPPAGPALRLRVVGIVRNGFDLAGRTGTPLTMPTPAFWEEYGGEIGIGSFSHWVRLVDEPGAVDRFTDAVRQAYGPEHLPSINVGQGEDAVADAISVVTTALAALAVVVGVGGAVWVGTAVLREERFHADSGETLRALGWTPRQRSMLLLGSVLPALAGGALLAPAVAVVLSPLFPVGIARRFDPSPGFRADAMALAAGTTLLLTLSGIAAGLVALRLVARSHRDDAPRGAPRALDSLTRALPPAAGTGARFALWSPRRAAPVWSALTGSGIIVTAVVTVAIVGSSLQRLVDTPERWGSPWDVAVRTEVLDGTPLDEGPPDGEVELDAEAILDTTAVDAAARLLYDEQVTVDGVEAIAMTVAPLKGGLTPSVVEGREPRADDEVALARDTLRDAGARVGATVRLAARSGESERFRVVGVIAFPVLGEPGSLAVGASLTAAGGDRLRLGDPSVGDDVGTPYLVLRWAPGTDPAATGAALGLPEGEAGFDRPVGPPVAPTEVAGLDDAKGFPLLAAAALVLVGVVGVAHSLFGTVGRRRKDLGILSALGFTPRQRRVVVRAQAVTIALVALALGIPLGGVVGRGLWVTLARTLGVAVEPVLPATWLILGAAGLVGVLLLLAAWPGRAARHLDVADALRTE